MTVPLSNQGAANDVIAAEARAQWQQTADEAGVNTTGFEPDAPLADRVAWALGCGLVIATIYTRFSGKRQHSTRDQVRECVEWAARNGMYVPPEFISVDEAVKGKRVRRDGIARMKAILQQRHATVLLVFKASRLFRQAFKGYELIHEEVVEEGLRAVSVSQGIDTDDTKAWKIQMQAHGLVDDMLLDAIADHVRAGLKGLHLSGYTTGAIGVGYRRRELPDAPLTNRGLPRTFPEIDPEAAELIRQHAQLLLDGMPLREGWRRWVKVNGPCDPRSTTGRMSYVAYRRLWSNIRLTGRWEFGRKRNQFSTKLDYTKQVEQPDDEVSVFQCEELRILADDTFLALQRLLQKNRRGPRKSKEGKPVELCDLTTEFFFCAHCSEPRKPIRFYQTGAGGRKVMRCKNDDLCPCLTKVSRVDAVRAVCDELRRRINADCVMIEDITSEAQQQDRRGDDELRDEIESLQRKIKSLGQRISDLHQLAGEGSEEDRKETRASIRAARAERSGLQEELQLARREFDGAAGNLTADDVRRILADFAKLLEDGASGKLGEDAVYKAVRVFESLTGGKIWVHVEERPGRTAKNVRGVFDLNLIGAIESFADAAVSNEETPVSREVSVWLREPPRVDRLAQRVHELIDLDGQSMRETAKTLQDEGHAVNSGNVWYSYQRWYEMQGQPVPKKPYNNGRPRKSA